MTGAQLCQMAFTLHAEIARKLRPTPDGFEDLTFHTSADRVVVWGPGCVEFADMAAVDNSARAIN